MANVEERTLTLVFGTTKNYFSGSGLYIDYQGWNQQPMAIWGSKNGTATMKDAGKAALYPKAGIHPFKADFNIIGASSVSDPVIQIHFDNTLVFQEQWPNDSTEHPVLYQGMIEPGILNSTIDSSITVNLSASATSLFGGFGLRNNSYFKLYFQQWDLTAQKVGNGAGFITCPGRVYDGESVDFYCNVGAHCTFHGWYSDIEHTNLVNSSIRYTVTASQDLTLYAYITRDTDIYNDLYIKSPVFNTDKWTIPYRYYIKTINGWELKNNKDAINKNLSYHYASSFGNGYIDNIGTSWTIVYAPYPRLIIYIKNPNNYIMLNWSGAENYYCCPFNEGFGVFFDGTYYSGSQQVSYTYITDIGNTPITKTFTLRLTVATHKMYFIDKDGNSFTETFSSNQPYIVTVPDGYTNFVGWKEIYQGEPTGRILTVGNSYYDVGMNSTIYYEPVFNE